MIVEAVTFDATGTLFHCPSLTSLYAEAFERHGVAVSPGQIAELFPVVWQELDCQTRIGGDRFADHPQGAKGFWEDVFVRICQLADAGQPSSFLAAELYQVFARGSSWQLFDETVSTLKGLRDAGFRMAVVSNWDERLVPLLRDLNLDQFFESIVVSAQVGHAKPDARIFAATTALLGLDPVQVLHVGDDRINDFEGATAAGMQAFLVERSRKKDLSAAARRARGSRI